MLKIKWSITVEEINRNLKQHKNTCKIVCDCDCDLSIRLIGCNRCSRKGSARHMMSLTVLSLPQRYKRLLQAMSLAVAVVYMTLLLYQSAYGYPGMQVSPQSCQTDGKEGRDGERSLCTGVGAPTAIVNCHTQRPLSYSPPPTAASPLLLPICMCFSPAVHLRLPLFSPSSPLPLSSFYVSCTFINQRWRRLQLRMRPAPVSFQSPLSLPLSLLHCLKPFCALANVLKSLPLPLPLPCI